MTPLKPISNLNLEQLINIIDIYTPPPTFNKQEEREIIQTVLSLSQDFISENPLCFSNPDIHNILIDNILELLFDQFNQLYEYNIKEDLEILVCIVNSFFIMVTIIFGKVSMSFKYNLILSCNNVFM